MTIKQLGGVFGRNPTFNDVTIEGELTFDGAIDVNSDLTIDGNLFVQNGDMTMTDNLPRLKLIDSDGTNQELYFEESGGIGSMTVRNGSNNGTLRLRANNGSTTTNTLEIDTSGNVKVLAGNLVIGTSGKGIDFSATAGTGTSELFDDYEEGVWTPNLLNGTSITYTTTPTGNYTKIGNMVYVTASIDVSNSDTADASALTIGGLPFNAINDTMTFTLGRYRSFLAPKDSVVLGAAANSSFIQLFESNNNFILYSEIGSSGILYFSGSYLT
jgi:hypothetical protein